MLVLTIYLLLVYFVSAAGCHCFDSYYDCWKSTTKRHNAVFQSIVEIGGQTENAIKQRINTGDTVDNANEKTVASILDTFCISLDFEILESGLPFYQHGLGS